MNRIFGGLTLLAAVAVVGLNGPPDAIAQTKSKTTTTTTTTKETATKEATFQLDKDAGGSFRYRLKDADGDILATSGKGDKTTDDAAKAIATIKAEAARAKVDDQTVK